MLIDLNQKLKDLKGADMVDAKTGQVLTFADVCITGLLMQPPKNINTREKLRRFNLALKIQAAGKPVELQPEEVSVLEEVVGVVGSPLVVGRFNELLKGIADGTNTPAK